MLRFVVLLVLFCTFVSFSWQEVYVLSSYTITSSSTTLSVVHSCCSSPVFQSSLSLSSFLSSSYVVDRTLQSSGDYAIDRSNVVRSTDAFTLDTCIQSPNKTIVLCTGHLDENNQSTAGVQLSFSVNVYGHLLVNASLSLSSSSSSSSSLPYNTLSMSYKHGDDVDTYTGFGFQYSTTKANGRVVPIFVREQGVGRGLEPLTSILNTYANNSGGDWHTSYGSIAHYMAMSSLSSHMYYLSNSEYAVFDLTQVDQAEKYITLTVNSTSIQFACVPANTPLQAVTSYTDLVGRMRPLPSWISSGAVIGMQGGTSFVREKLDLLRQNQCPISSFWLQDWVGSRVVPWGIGLWWNWELDSSQYPDWPLLLSDLRALNIRVMVYVNPMLKDVSTKANYTNNYFQQAQQNGYLVIDQNTNQPWTGYAGASMIDLTSPAAVGWYKNIFKSNILQQGISGYMADFGESLPLTASFNVSNTELTASQLHNRWPELWMKLNREIIDELNLQNEVIYFSRSASMNSLPYTSLAWMGDQLTTFDAYDGLQSALIGMLSSGLSGFAFSHSDIGGYTAVQGSYADYEFNITRSETLFKRWCEFSAFTTVYRTHDGNLPSANWQFYSSPSTLSHFSRLSHVYVSWSFYRSLLINEGATVGWPVVRPMFMHFMHDDTVRTNTTSMQRQYTIGDEFIVAPFMDDTNATTALTSTLGDVLVYLPPLPDNNVWVHLWTDVKMNNGWNTVQAQEGKTPAFYKLGSNIAAEFISNLDAAGLRK